MPPPFTLEQVGALAGVSPSKVEAWVHEGRLGSVEKDPAGLPVMGFEQASKAVDLGGRGTRRRLCVVNQKGGVGKTTTAFSLAGAFADLGRRVLAVDLDAQANLTSSFGYDPDGLDRTSESLLTEEDVTAEDVILETAIDGVHLIPADIRLCRVDVKIHEAFLRELILQHKLRHLFEHYHVVLFDCPPNLGQVTINALLASDEVVVPVETQSYSIKALADLTSTFGLIRQKMGHALRLWILPTKVDRTSALAADFLGALERAFGPRLLPAVGADADLVRAPMTYEPIGRSFPQSRAAREYARIAKFLCLPDAERETQARSAWKTTPDAAGT